MTATDRLRYGRVRSSLGWGISRCCVLILLIAGCVERPQPTASPVPATQTSVRATATTSSPVVTFTASPEPTPSATATPASFIFQDLDQNGVWNVYEEGAPQWQLRQVSEPSLDGTALQCSLTGGQPYSNAHCYQNLAAMPEAKSFKLSLSFWFSPITTCNNQGSPSGIQAIEFTMSQWLADQRFEFALQWQNVGAGAPQWRYWDPNNAEKWRALTPPVVDCLQAQVWNTLELEGELRDGQVYYRAFTFNDRRHELDLTAPAVSTPGEIDRLAVAIQLDGNASQTPYDVFIDQVDLSLHFSP